MNRLTEASVLFDLPSHIAALKAPGLALTGQKCSGLLGST